MSCCGHGPLTCSPSTYVGMYVCRYVYLYILSLNNILTVVNFSIFHATGLTDAKNCWETASVDNALSAPFGHSFTGYSS